MLAAVFTEKKNIDVCDFSLRTIQKNELLIKVASCGVCGTDRHIYDGVAPSSIPIILGHEFSGIIVEKGDSNNEFMVGDKVAIDPNIYCWQCNYCKKGMVNFCKNLKALGVNINGGFAEYSIVPSSQVYRLPNDFNLNLAAFAEPLSCCVRGIENADIKPGNTVVIIGGGSIGLIMIQLVQNSGASKIILVEPCDYKRQLGLDLGADFSIDPNDHLAFKAIEDLTNSQVDIVIECVGKNTTVEDAIKIAGKGGKVVIFGLTPADQNIVINLQSVFHKELKIINSYLNPFTFKKAVDLLINSRINVKKLISRQVYLKDITDVFNNNLDVQHIVKTQIINFN
ncbi:MAG: zinc-dependent alcohol dehydrogenase family protein [Ignavibacteriaceae bacterium]|nr:zinc-dependent alcohol dehydrogenase family protein [Ignavibacteriaceae bacterium]